jgi:hypothetical protein
MSRRPWIPNRADVEIVALLALALAVLAVGIRVGMLLAPRVERMADRAGRVGQDPETGAEKGPETVSEGASTTHEGDDGHTD